MTGATKVTISASPTVLFTNCKETKEQISLTPNKPLPSWLKGTLYRTGPGTFDINLAKGGTFTFKHWFDCLTTVHAFSIDGSSNTVKYMNRHMFKDIEKTIEETGHLPMGSFGESSGFTSKVKSVVSDSYDQIVSRVTNTGVTVDVYPSTDPGKKTMQLELYSDSPFVQTIDPHTLGRIESYVFSKHNPDLKGYGGAAHPQIDTETGEVYNFLVEVGTSPKYIVYKRSAEHPKGKIVARFSAPFMYCHSFSMTKNYVILVLPPVVIDPITYGWSKNNVESQKWKPQQGTRFYVIDRKKDDVVGVFQSDAFFTFHTTNAWEEDGKIVMQMLNYDNADIVTELMLKKLREGGQMTECSVCEVKIDISQIDASTVQHPANAPKASVTAMVGLGAAELPRFNPNFTFKKSRYIYSVGAHTSSVLFGNVIKADTVEKKLQKVTNLNYKSFCEMVFVPKPDSVEEEDGVLLTVGLTAENKSVLICIDPKTMEKISEADLPQGMNIPAHFHGSFIPQEKLDRLLTMSKVEGA